MKKLLLILLSLPIIGFGQINLKSEKSVREYFEKNAIELEGIWNYKLYRLAFIKENNNYTAIVIDKFGVFDKGNIKATFEVDSLNSNIVINFKGNKKQDIICNGKIISNQRIEFVIPGEKEGSRTFTKEYPLFDFTLYDENFYKSKENFNQLVNLQNDIKLINLKMELHHKQYFNSLWFTLIGFGLTTIGATNPKVGSNGYIFIGGTLSLTGSIMMIRSHRWFKKKPKGIYSKINY
jgi:hypothetical protein